MKPIPATSTNVQKSKKCNTVIAHLEGKKRQGKRGKIIQIISEREILQVAGLRRQGHSSQISLAEYTYLEMLLYLFFGLSWRLLRAK